MGSKWFILSTQNNSITMYVNDLCNSTVIYIWVYEIKKAGDGAIFTWLSPRVSVSFLLFIADAVHPFGVSWILLELDSDSKRCLTTFWDICNSTKVMWKYLWYLVITKSHVLLIQLYFVAYSHCGRNAGFQISENKDIYIRYILDIQI